MPNVALSAAVARIVGPDPAETDGRLLGRFVRTRDEAAFRELVRRLGPMVLGVCRRIAGDHHLAEDAFQAAFLVLARRAADVVPREAVRGWLHGVAVRTAQKARTMSARRRARELPVPAMPDRPVVEPHAADPESLRVLDEEVGRLPDHLRAAVALCELEGVSRRDAAARLGVPEGTLSSRLAKARAVLAGRLRGRGVALTAAGLCAALGRPASAAVPPRLLDRTAALSTSPGPVPPSVAALTETVVKAMFVTKIKSVLTVLVLAALVGGAGLVYQTRAADPPKDAPKKIEEKPVPEPPMPQPAKTDRERMVGNWFIVNEDSLRQGEMWVITEDSILMHAKDLGLNTHHYAHRLDAGKNPKQIDITVTQGNGSPVGVIKGIYALDGDELRLCLGEMDKDRPAAFPEKPRPGEVLVLRRERWGATPPTAKDARSEPKGPAPEEATKQGQEKDTAKPAGPGILLLIRAKPGNGTMDDRYEVLTPDGKAVSEFTAPEGTRGGGQARLSPDGTRVVLAVTQGEPKPTGVGAAPPPSPFKVVVLTPGKPDAGKGWSMPADWLTLCWTADGKRVIVGKHSITRGAGSVENVLLDPETGKTEPLDLPAGAWVLDAARDGKTFLVAAPGEKKLKLGLAEAGDLAVRELAEVPHSPPGSVTGRLSPDGTRVLFTAADPARKNAHKWGMSYRPYLLDVKTKKVEPLADFPENGVARGVSWSPDGERVAYTWDQLHEEVLKRDTITVASTTIDTEAFLVVADADGKNPRKIASGKSKYAMAMILGAIDWR
jgi:RNA polymerase sigma factor (sigma-70 family)